jgi:hypothetical protein
MLTSVGDQGWTFPIPIVKGKIEKLLVEKGLADVRTLPGPPRDFKMIVAGRRPT